MVPPSLPTTVCFCGRIIRNDDGEEGSIYCSSACARLDSMSALCAQESFDATAGSRVKQVLRIGRKEALAKSSHYRRMERFGIGPARSPQRAAVAPATSRFQSAKVGVGLRVAESSNDMKAAPKIAVARLQPAPKALRPLLLGSNFGTSKVTMSSPPDTAPRAPPPKLPVVEDEDDASDYGEDDDEVPLARYPQKKNEGGLLSHFSDSSFGSKGLAASNSGSTLSSMSSLTPSSSTGSLADSLADSSLSTVSLASSIRSQEARLIHNIPCIPLNVKSLQALETRTKSEGVPAAHLRNSEDVATPKAGLGILRLDMEFDDASWRFDSSESALCDLLRDF